MNTKKFRSIRVKLVFLLFLSASIALTIVLIKTFAFTYVNERQDGLQSLSKFTSIIGENLIASVEFEDEGTALSTLNSLKFSSDIEAAYIYTNPEDVFASYQSSESDAIFENEVIPYLYKNNNIKDAFEVSELGILAVNTPLISDGDYLGSLIIISNLNSFKKAIFDQVFTLLIASALSLIIIVILAFKLERIFTLPIFELKKAMDQVSKDDRYSVHTNFKSNDEFKSLFDGFNYMLSAIREKSEQMQIANKKVETSLLESKSLNEKLSGLSKDLSRYLSPQVYESIFLGKSKANISSSRKKLTVFFSDIKGFTELTDTLETESLTEVLNSYLNAMSKIALKHGGTIDKFIGDAILIFFGDPYSKGEQEDAIACTSMAIEMRREMIRLRKMWSGKGFVRPLQIRAGITTGYCTVGNFGSNERMDYTIIGNQVNLASRLESSAEVNEIQISYSTYVLIKDVIKCIEKGELSVKGFGYPIKTFQVDDFIGEIESKHEFVKENDGFFIDLDTEKISSEEKKEQIRYTLKEALSLIDEKNEDSNL